MGRLAPRSSAARAAWLAAALAWPAAAAAPEVGAPSAPPPAVAPAQSQVAPAKPAQEEPPSPAAVKAVAAARPNTPDLASPDFSSPESDEGPGFGANIIRMLAALGVVLALIYIVLNFGLRRLMGARALPIGGAVVSVVQRLPVDAKHSLLVVKAAGEYVLVGSGDAGMSLISKLDGETVDRLQRERAQATPVMSPFLQKLLSRRRGRPPGPQGTNP
jgi:flagellar protein FliO/FliZ